jgi:cupin fold WbuC family metalloprotein
MFRAESENTVFFIGGHFTFSENYGLMLLGLAKNNISGTARICLHESQSESTQSMIICILQNRSFKPHYHPKCKSESYTVIRGKLYVDIMEYDGTVKETLCLTSQNTPYLHKGLTLHRSYTLGSYAIFHEVFHGTFDKEYDVLEID